MVLMREDRKVYATCKVLNPPFALSSVKNEQENYKMYIFA